MQECAIQTCGMSVNEKTTAYGEGVVTYMRPRQVPNKTAPKVLSRAGIIGSTTNGSAGAGKSALGTTMMCFCEDAIVGHAQWGIYP